MTTAQAPMTGEEYAALHDQIVGQLARGGSLGQLKGMTADECEALYSCLLYTSPSPRDS